MIHNAAPLRRILLPFVSIAVPVLVSAHPGHDHSDIPSVIRHPFAGLEHVVVTAAVVGALSVAAVVLARRFARQVKRRHQ